MIVLDWGFRSGPAAHTAITASLQEREGAVAVLAHLAPWARGKVYVTPPPPFFPSFLPFFPPFPPLFPWAAFLPKRSPATVPGLGPTKFLVPLS